MVVLVVLVLSNIGLTIYLSYKIHFYTDAVDRNSRIYSIISNNNLEKIISQIKAIPKEITVKNVLNIP
jgi:hypothetical protein